MKNYCLLIALIIVTTACETKKQENSENTSEARKELPVTLQLKWETNPLLTTCESVIYDEAEDILYVSNIDGAPDEKDSNGFISKVSLAGVVTEQQWVTGMDAPKGMGLHNGKLYVSDIDRVHEIDTKTGEITNTFTVEGATFLNDIAVDNGKVYISDSGGGSIYLLEDGELSTWMTDLKGPNGMFIDGGKMVVGLWDAQTVSTIDISSEEVTQRTGGIENPDGVEAVGSNEYLVSSWNGMIHHIDADWKKALVLDTRQDSVYSADIEYIKSKNLLLVPTFFKNKVVAYEVVNDSQADSVKTP